jgi:hypothetical protein
MPPWRRRDRAGKIERFAERPQGAESVGDLPAFATGQKRSMSEQTDQEQAEGTFP